MIEMSNIFVQFPNIKAPVLRNLTFTLHRGDKVLLVGPSGCGKTVFLKTMMGLIPGSQVTGTIKVNSETLTYNKYRNHSIHNKFSTIFQDAVHSLHPYRNISSQCTVNNNKVNPKDFELFRLQYKNIENEYPCRLSGGQCQRISLMFPYLLEREIIFFDEPITDIDQISRKSILEVIKKHFFTDQKKTLIYVTHSYEELKDIDFKKYKMKNGTLKRYDCGK